MFGALYLTFNRQNICLAVKRRNICLVSDVGDSAKKYKTAIFKPKPSKF
jgi:hypothetical protein